MLGRFQQRKWTKLFTIYDQDNTGLLKASDFKKFAGTLSKVRGWLPDSKAHKQVLDKFMGRWEHIKAVIHADGADNASTEISLGNWIDYHKAMLIDSDQYQDEIQAFAEVIFDICDVDDSGHIDLKEWMALFKAFGLPVVYAQEAFSFLDSNLDGMLQKDEVAAAVNDFFYSDDPATPANFMFGPY